MEKDYYNNQVNIDIKVNLNKVKNKIMESKQIIKINLHILDNIMIIKNMDMGKLFILENKKKLN